MQSISQLVTSNKKLETRNKLTSLEVRNRALSIMGDLASTEAPNDMTAWYCKAYRTLGESRLMAIVKAAKDPSVRNQKSMAGWLIKEEMKARA